MIADLVKSPIFYIKNESELCFARICVERQSQCFIVVGNFSILILGVSVNNEKFYDGSLESLRGTRSNIKL